MNPTTSFIVSLVAVAIAIGAWVYQPVAQVQAPGFGSATASFMDATLGFKINGTYVIDPRSGTTTEAIGCQQITPTSTQTTAKIVLSTAGATSTFNGTAYWQYGTCP